MVSGNQNRINKIKKGRGKLTSQKPEQHGFETVCITFFETGRPKYSAVWNLEDIKKNGFPLFPDYNYKFHLILIKFDAITYWLAIYFEHLQGMGKHL